MNKTESVLQQIGLPEHLFNVIDHRMQLYLDSGGNIVKAGLSGLDMYQETLLCFQQAYTEVTEFICNVPAIGIDETGYKNSTYNSTWTWCQQTPEAVLFYITISRDSKVFIDIFDQDFCGTVICDYFSANKKFANLTKAWIQYCWAHLARDIKFLLTSGCRNLQQ